MSVTLSDEEAAMVCESIERDKAEIRQLRARLERLEKLKEAKLRMKENREVSANG